MGIVFIIGAFQAFFLEFLLLNKKNKTVSNKILAVWMFFLGIHLFSYYLYYSGIESQYPHLIGIPTPFPLVHGPFLFLYIQSFIREERYFKWFDYLHFLPVLIIYTYMYNFFFSFTGPEKIEYVESLQSSPTAFIIIGLISIVLSGIIYVSYSLIYLRRHRKLILSNFSYDEKINLIWLRNLIYGVAGVWVVIIATIVVSKIFKLSFTFEIDNFIYASVTIFILILGFYGIKQVGVFSDPKLAKDVYNDIPSQTTESQYSKSGLKPEQAKIHHEALLEIMNEKQPYLDAKLSLSQLAKHIKIKPNHLSQVINQYQNTNFYDFINQFRVEEFKNRIKKTKNKHLNILAIAYDCGFNSKSSFNNVFKKLTGITPSKYINSLSASN